MKRLPQAACVFFILAVHICFGQNSVKQPKEKTLCLNMIVKDESEVIKRCLASVKDLIDYWVIVDTGSKDGTQKIIKDCLKGIPGKLYERPWVNFEHNRNEALELAKDKADYLLFIDADEELVFSSPLDKAGLDKDAYVIKIVNESVVSARTLIINNRLPGWKWIGVLHEYLYNPHAKTAETLTSVKNLANRFDGQRSKDPQKYLKDAKLLEKELEKDPTHSRYQFYLAQSYLNAKEQELALKHFQKRVAMGKDKEDLAEICWSLLMIGEIQERLEMPEDTVIEAYSRAFYYQPTVAEPLLRLASFLCGKEKYLLAYSIAKMGFSIPPSKQHIFSMPWIYDYGFQSVIAECCFRMGRFDEAYDMLSSIKKEGLDPDLVRQIDGNLEVIKTSFLHSVGEKSG